MRAAVNELGPEVPTSSGWTVGDHVIISPSLRWGDDERFPSTEYEILGSPTRHACRVRRRTRGQPAGAASHPDRGGDCG